MEYINKKKNPQWLEYRCGIRFQTPHHTVTHYSPTPAWHGVFYSSLLQEERKERTRIRFPLTLRVKEEKTFLSKMKAGQSDKVVILRCFCDCDPGHRSLPRRFWPTCSACCWCVSGCSWATWWPEKSSDDRRTPRKRLCLSTSALWARTPGPACLNTAPTLQHSSSALVSSLLIPF